MGKEKEIDMFANDGYLISKEDIYSMNNISENIEYDNNINLNPWVGTAFKTEHNEYKPLHVKMKKLENYPEEIESLPQYADSGCSGFDIRSAIDFEISEGQTILVPTGFCLQIPKGYELQIRSRSGLAAKEGIFVLNGVGTVDSSYVGQIQVILHKVFAPFTNTKSGKKTISFKRGDRIAQGVFCPVYHGMFNVVEELDKTERNDGGFGSTGIS